MPIPQPVGAVYPYYAADVNDAGAVVGQYWDEDGRVHSTLLVNGVHQSIDVPGAWGTQAQGINNLGQVVGTFSTDLAQNSTPFIYTNGVHAPLALPGALPLPLDINDRGVVVGTTWDPSFAFTFGFVSGPTGTQLVRYAGASYTSLDGINDTSDAVGLAQTATGSVSVRYKDGALSLLSAPDGDGCYIVGISDAADLVGGCADGTGYLFSGGSALRLSYGGDTSTQFNKISASGTVVGSSNSGAFVLLRSKLVDPVPDLLAGPAVTSTPSALASEGRLVQGVAADGVARVVVRIPAATAGQQFTVRLLNDHAPRALSTSDKEDGALATVAAQTSWVSQLTVTAESETGTTPMAFVIYRSPEDFPRVGTPVAPGAFGPDDVKASRQVFLEITPQGGQPFVQTVEIVRPPVLMVHGLWSNSGTWNRFSPFISGPDLSSSRFTIQRSDYSRLVSHIVGPVESTVPTYPASDLPQIRANSMGLDFNADLVEQDIAVLVQSGKLDNNPSGLPIASVQVDVVAHSMGGAVARTIHARRRNFGWHTFGAGSIHKLITIDTPHRGSQVATQLIGPLNACMRRRITLFAPNFALETTNIRGAAGPTRGAVGDLVDSPLSDALQRIAAPGVPPLPVSFVAGTYEDWPALNLAPAAIALRLTCDDPLAQALTPDGWRSIFGNQPNDAIVSRSSQINNLSRDDSAVVERSGYLHSDGTTALGFSKPSILDPGYVPDFVSRALNEPTYNTLLFRRTP